jgi:TetR/AcrR family transcriptional regulator
MKETEARLIAASLALFSKLGFNGVTTKALAQKAGVTEKTLFHYFPTKRDLYEKAFYPQFFAQTGRLGLGEVHNVLLSESLSLKEKLILVVSNLLGYMYQNQAVLFLVAQEMLLNKEFRAMFSDIWLRRHRDLYRALINDSKNSGELRELSKESIVEAIFSLTLGHGISQILFSTPLISTIDAEAGVLVDILLNGIQQDL